MTVGFDDININEISFNEMKFLYFVKSVNDLLCHFLKEYYMYKLQLFSEMLPFRLSS